MRKIHINSSDDSEEIYIAIGLDRGIKVSKSEMAFIVKKLVEDGHLDYRVLEGIKEELNTF